MVTTDHPLSILYAGTLPPHPGGSAISASQLLIGIARAGHRVRAIGPITEATEEEGSAFDAAHPELAVSRYRITQYYTRVFQPRGAALHDAEGAAVRRHLVDLVAEERPDLIFAGREMYAWYVPDAVEGLDVPLLMRVAGGTLYGLVSRQYPVAAAQDLVDRLRRFDLLVTPAAYMARQLHDLDVRQTRTILNAIDLDMFAPRDPDDALRRDLRLDPSDRVALAIGNLHARKRSLDIVVAVQRALADDPRVLCVLIGMGPLQREIEAHIRRAGIADRFRLPGWVPYHDVPRYLSIAEAVLHAAEGEGLARAWLEAQAAGVPLIASDLEAVHEVAADRKTALLFPVGDSDAMARRLLELFGNPVLQGQLSLTARQTVQAHALPAAVAAYVAAMRELSERAGREPRHRVPDAARASGRAPGIERTARANPVSEDQHSPFRERLDRRAELWWATRTPGMHGPRRCHELRLAHDTESQWKCCRYWQRKLSNKWNAREFATRHGVRVPRLYWSGNDVDAIPFDKLPDAYVIRLTSGHSGKQVVVMRRGVNLLDGIAYTQAQLRERFAALLQAAFSRTLMLVEEYVPPQASVDESGLPPNYRFHMFGDVVAWVSVSCARANYGHFADDWEPFPIRVMKSVLHPYPWPRPIGLERMLDVARRLGRAFETYVRVDLYDSDGDPIFAEFAPIPSRGRSYTAEADARLERLWTEHYPGTL